MSDMLDSYALAKLVILRAATLCSFVIAQRVYGGSATAEKVEDSSVT